ncbi:hypothetical protein Q31a_49170 [Aureliella helgolandensis]|uniref:Uncharacterized protein n=1 Tax=Aureliella helgolandensis TaxID=2527968 RepID=A0A518GD75_9BACT|nr:hypothetical protein Q31a_49170 [Aureliella helgolandensis]
MPETLRSGRAASVPEPIGLGCEAELSELIPNGRGERLPRGTPSIDKQPIERKQLESNFGQPVLDGEKRTWSNLPAIEGRYYLRCCCRGRGDYRFDARHAVIANGYETNSMLREKVVKLDNTFALVFALLENIAPWECDWMMWQAKEPYLYLRITDDQCLIVGAKMMRFTVRVVVMRVSQSKRKRLNAKFANYFLTSNGCLSLHGAEPSGKPKMAWPTLDRLTNPQLFLRIGGWRKRCYLQCHYLSTHCRVPHWQDS